MSESPTPIWQPLSRLPLIASQIDEQLAGSEEQRQNLAPLGRRAPVLDDALVARIIRVYTEQQEMPPVYAEQLARWKKEKLTPEQRAEIERLERQLMRYDKAVSDIIELAHKHAQFTIEKAMAKDDAEVGS